MRHWASLTCFVIVTLSAPVGLRAADFTFNTVNVDFSSVHDDLFGCVASGLNDRAEVVGGCNDRNRNSNFRGFSFDGRKFSEIKLAGTKFFEKKNDGTPLPSEVILALRSVYQNAPFLGGTRLVEQIRGRKDPRSRNLPNPQDMNNFGAITGWFFDGTRLKGFLKRQGADVAISFPEAQLTEAIGINDEDQIVGDFRDASGRFRSFIYDSSGFRAVDVSFAPNADSGAFGINNLGKVVGCFSACSRGFLFDSRSAQFISLDVPGAVISQPSDINDDGKVVGAYFDGQVLRGFLFDGSAFHTIDVPGAISTNVTGINNAGEIVGTYVVETPQGDFDSIAFIGVPR